MRDDKINILFNNNNKKKDKMNDQDVEVFVSEFDQMFDEYFD